MSTWRAFLWLVKHDFPDGFARPVPIDSVIGHAGIHEYSIPCISYVNTFSLHFMVDATIPPMAISFSHNFFLNTFYHLYFTSVTITRSRFFISKIHINPTVVNFYSTSQLFNLHFTIFYEKIYSIHKYWKKGLKSFISFCIGTFLQMKKLKNVQIKETMK